MSDWGWCLFLEFGMVFCEGFCVEPLAGLLDGLDLSSVRLGLNTKSASADLLAACLGSDLGFLPLSLRGS